VASVDILQIQATMDCRRSAQIRPEIVASGGKAALVTGWRSQDVYILHERLGVKHVCSVDETHGGYSLNQNFKWLETATSIKGAARTLTFPNDSPFVGLQKMMRNKAGSGSLRSGLHRCT
jgi:hypothetical protein